MKKQCDTCSKYAVAYQYCSAKYIKVGRNLVEYCKDYVPKRGKNLCQTKN